jgi:hypothetical protein
VVFRARAGSFDPFALYSVPADGSAPPTRISGAGNVLPVAGNPFVALSPDGTLAIYRADPDLAQVYELFVVPVDGSLPPVKLNPTYTSIEDVTDFQINADGNFVVYLATQDLNFRCELYRVPIDGSAPAFKVSPDPVPGGSVLADYEITADDSHVVYRARQEGEHMTELFSTFVLPAPASVTPNRGPASGGNEVLITGCGFTPETEVFFAGTPGTVTFLSSSQLRVVVPANFRIPPPTRGPGIGKIRQVTLQNLVVDIHVETADLGSTLPAAYTYEPRL